jgi:predicted transcriptional regulator of viral defense system
MSEGHTTQLERALSLLKSRGIMRRSEFDAEKITGATLQRLLERGDVIRLGRGIYQLPGAPIDTNHSLAEVTKRIPKGVVCLTSALAFHELTDAVPSRVWVAIGPKDWRPRIDYPPVQIVRFGKKELDHGIEEHVVEGTKVRIYSAAKTVVDMFRYRQSAGVRYRHSPGLNLAIEGLREALRKRKATPGEISRYAINAGIWKVMEPYVEAMTANA